VQFFLKLFLNNHLIFLFNKEAKSNVSNSSVLSDLNIEKTTILNEVEKIIDENSKMESTTISNENQVEDKGKFFFKFFFELNN